MPNPLPPSSLEKVLGILEQTYPDAHCELNFSNPFQLLIATILSAQCTDKKVNLVTEKLFANYPTPQAFLKLGQVNLENEIKELGLYRHKAKNILATCQDLLNRYEGRIPADLDDLTSLPGVGRKTANVVAGNAFGIPALAVDTHVFRVSNRLGLACSQKVEEVEKQLKETIPKEKWNQAHHWLIWHGRRCCTARKPACDRCSLQDYCNYFILNSKPR